MGSRNPYTPEEEPAFASPRSIGGPRLFLAQRGGDCPRSHRGLSHTNLRVQAALGLLELPYLRRGASGLSETAGLNKWGRQRGSRRQSHLKGKIWSKKSGVRTRLGGSGDRDAPTIGPHITGHYGYKGGPTPGYSHRVGWTGVVACRALQVDGQSEASRNIPSDHGTRTEIPD